MMHSLLNITLVYSSPRKVVNYRRDAGFSLSRPDYNSPINYGSGCIGLSVVVNAGDRDERGLEPDSPAWVRCSRRRVHPIQRGCTLRRRNAVGRVECKAPMKCLMSWMHKDR